MDFTDSMGQGGSTRFLREISSGKKFLDESVKSIKSVKPLKPLSTSRLTKKWFG